MLHSLMYKNTSFHLWNHLHPLSHLNRKQWLRQFCSSITSEHLISKSSVSLCFKSSLRCAWKCFWWLPGVEVGGAAGVCRSETHAQLKAAECEVCVGRRRERRRETWEWLGVSQGHETSSLTSCGFPGCQTPTLTKPTAHIWVSVCLALWDARPRWASALSHTLSAPFRQIIHRGNRACSLLTNLILHNSRQWDGAL